MLTNLLENHQRHHCKDYYYAIRSSTPNDIYAKAARTIYLNRTCWNGLYRVNLNGQFNVPIGTKTKVISTDDNFEEISNILSGAELRCADFEETVTLAEEGDLVFVDPPYTTAHNLNGFVKYNENIFTWSDQVRLASCIALAVKRGVIVFCTNADHPSVRALYENIGTLKSVSRASVIAGKSSSRRSTSELLFTSDIH